MDKDRLYTDLFLSLQRFIQICNLEDFQEKENYKEFSKMMHNLSDSIYLLEIIDKEDEII